MTSAALQPPAAAPRLVQQPRPAGRTRARGVRQVPASARGRRPAHPQRSATHNREVAGSRRGPAGSCARYVPRAPRRYVAPPSAAHLSHPAGRPVSWSAPRQCQSPAGPYQATGPPRSRPAAAEVSPGPRRAASAATTRAASACARQRAGPGAEAEWPIPANAGRYRACWPHRPGAGSPAPDAVGGEASQCPPRADGQHPQEPGRGRCSARPRRAGPASSARRRAGRLSWASNKWLNRPARGAAAHIAPSRRVRGKEGAGSPRVALGRGRHRSRHLGSRLPVPGIVCPGARKIARGTAGLGCPGMTGVWADPRRGHTEPSGALRAGRGRASRG